MPTTGVPHKLQCYLEAFKQRAGRARGEVGRCVIHYAADTPGLLPVG